MDVFPVPETRFPALRPLLAGSLWQRWVEKKLVFPREDFRRGIRYVRLKPSSSCRLVVFGDGSASGNGCPLGFLLQLYTDPDRAREAFEKESTRRHLVVEGGRPPFVCAESAVVGIPFPNDPRIPGLRHLYRPHRLRALLAEILEDDADRTWRIRRTLSEKRLLAYKPGRRAAFRIDAVIDRRGPPDRIRVPLHVKLETPEACRTSYRKMQAIHAAIPRGAEWRVPRPRGLVESRSLTAAEWCEGRSLADIVRSGDDALSALRSSGRALAEFHDLDLDLEAGPSPADEAESIRDLGADLVLLLPREEKRIRRLALHLADRLSTFRPAPDATVHGDFHLAQVLVDDRRPVIVDLDRSGRGDAASDVGFLLAHLAEIGAGKDAGQAFLQGYGEAAAVAPDRESVRLWTAVGLFRRTVVAFRRLLPDWPERIRHRIDQVERRVKDPD